MQKPKIIFLDIDGTLVDFSQQLPASAAKAVRLAKQNGHKIFISTGRSKPQIFSEVMDLEPDGLIGGNGVYVEAGGQVIHNRTIPPDMLAEIVDYLNSRQVGFVEEANSGHYGNAWYAPQVAEKFELSLEEAETRIRRIFPIIQLDTNLDRADVNKISAVISPRLDIAELNDRFSRDFLVGTWHISEEKYKFADLSQKNINKGRAVELLLNHLGCDVADTIAFGDADNDIEMLAFCGIGVAMGNASDEIKAVADHVTNAVTDDGLWNGFKHLNLI